MDTTIQINDKLKHLSQTQVIELSARYENGEKCSSLIAEYKIDTTPNKLAKILPLCKAGQSTCPYCIESMYREVRRKNNYSYNRPYAVCLKCPHVEYDTNSFYSESCSCIQCENIKKHEADVKTRQKNNLISQKYSTEYILPYPYSRLCFSEKLFLLGLCESNNTVGDYIFSSLNDTSHIKPFAPSFDMGIYCLKTLLNREILLISPDSPPELFNDEDDLNPFSFDDLLWEVNVSIDDNKKSSIAMLRKKITQDIIFDSVKPEWSNEVYNLIFKIAAEEAMQNIVIKIANHRELVSLPQKSTIESIYTLLQEFSVNEIRYFSKLAIDNAISFYNSKKEITKKYATNTIPNKMLERAARAKENSWKINRFPRDATLPRSSLSIILLEKIFKDGDSGFYTPLHKYWEDIIKPQYFTTHKSNEIHCATCKSYNVVPIMNNGIIHVACNECHEINHYDGY